ncbi:3TM-type holin [Xanthomonas albilineans]|nr:3TM-type holin [Xanthomonas albilineans]QHQ29130.1 hypothetical protein XaFJ1_GM002415 [Xanthomonas albilineans]
MDISGIGTAAEAAKSIIGMFFPDKTEQDKTKLAATLTLIQTQTDIDKAKAQSSDPLQHWRGGLGWVCVARVLLELRRRATHQRGGSSRRPILST